MSDENRFALADGLSLSFTAYPGSHRPWFLLVHGLASNQQMWAGVATHLSQRGHGAITVDLRGHGRSSPADTDYGVPEVAADLAALLEHLDRGPAVVAGQSWGGNVVLELAQTRPDLVSGAVAVDGGWINLAELFPRWEDCWAALAPPPLVGLPADAVESMIRNMHPDWPESGVQGALANFERREDGTVSPRFSRSRHEQALHGLWQDKPHDRNPEIGVPVMLVPARAAAAGWSGDKDQAVSATQKAIPRCQVEWMDGDHDLHAQHPAAIAELILRWSVSEIPT